MTIQNKKLFSLQLEKQLIAALLKFPQKYNEICAFLAPEDFGDPSQVCPTIYRIIGKMVLAAEAVDATLVGQNVVGLGIKFEDGLSVFDYLQSLSMRAVSSDSSIIEIAKAIKKYSVRRCLISNARQLEKKMLELSDDASFDEIISVADNTYNKEIDLYFNHSETPKNIFEDMEANIEYRGENPLEDDGFVGPFPTLHLTCGSLLKPGNITVIVSRYGVGKSTLAIDYCSKVGAKYSVPVLHFDNGEMSYVEIQNRMCSAISGVSLYLINTGQWRQNPKTVEAVRACWSKVKKLKFFYYNVGGIEYKEMINICRRWYYTNVGRGNKMIWSFDYIKALSLGGNTDNFWLGIGLMLDAMKSFITKEIVYEGEPQIALFTSVQANKSGIINRPDKPTNDSEEVVALSDMIGQIASHLLLLRKKTSDEIQFEGIKFGTHKLFHLKGRHLGKDPSRILDMVQTSDGKLVKNHFNLMIDNFNTEERGDYVDFLNSLNISNVRPQQDGKA